MKVLILYYSKGGNTRKLAEAVAEGVGQVDGVEAVLRHTREVTQADFVAADGLVVGSPVYFGTMAAQLKQILDDFISVRKKMENKVGAAFATSGDASGGKETTMMSIIQALLIYGMIIAGDPMAATGHYGTACVGAPDTAAQENGRKLGHRVADLVTRLHRSSQQLGRDAMKIEVKKPQADELEQQGVFEWPVWEKEVSRFDWHYDTEETCYLLEGRVAVSTPDGGKVEFGAGDLVRFPAGLSCVWDITEPVRKHYRFG